MSNKRPITPAFPVCCFSFADGRRCALPASPRSNGLCYTHAHAVHRPLRLSDLVRELTTSDDSPASAPQIHRFLAKLPRALVEGLITLPPQSKPTTMSLPTSLPILLTANGLQSINRPSPLTLAFPIHASLLPNSCPLYILPTALGRGLLVIPHILQSAQPLSALATLYSSLTTPRVPLRSGPLNAKINPLLAQGRETFARSPVSNTLSGPRLQRSALQGAQPIIASKPQVLLRRWGRKADRVRLGQCPLVG